MIAFDLAVLCVVVACALRPTNPELPTRPARRERAANKSAKLIQKTLTIQETNLPTGPSDDRWEERGFMNEKAKVAGMNANKRIAKTIVASS